MLVFSALVAGSFSLGALVSPLVDPAAFMAVRFALAAIIVAAIAGARGVWAVTAFRGAWRYILLGGLYALYFVLMFEGLKTAPPVSAAAVFTLVPIMAAGFAFVLLRQSPSLRIASALAVGGVGAVWVIFRADLSALLAFSLGRGEAVYFIGCVAHALYAPMVTRLNRGEHVVMFTFGTVLAGAALLAAWSAPAILATDWMSLPPIVWIGLGYTALFATAFSVLLLQFAALRLPSAKVMAYTYLVPTWVIGLEIALGAGAPTVWVFGGVALTVAALLLLLRNG